MFDATRIADDLTFWVDQQVVRHANGLVVEEECLVALWSEAVLCPRHLVFLHGFAPSAVVLVARDGYNFELGAVDGVVKSLDIGCGHSTDAAPRCPEVDKQGLAFVCLNDICQLTTGTVRRDEVEINNGIAHCGLLCQLKAFCKAVETGSIGRTLREGLPHLLNLIGCEVVGIVEQLVGSIDGHDRSGVCHKELQGCIDVGTFVLDIAAECHELAVVLMGWAAHDMEVGSLRCIRHEVVGCHLNLHIGILNKDMGVGPLDFLGIACSHFFLNHSEVVSGQRTECGVLDLPFNPELTVLLHSGLSDFICISVLRIQQSYFDTCRESWDGAVNAEALLFGLLFALTGRKEHQTA